MKSTSGSKTASRQRAELQFAALLKRPASASEQAHAAASAPSATAGSTKLLSRKPRPILRLA